MNPRQRGDLVPLGLLRHATKEASVSVRKEVLCNIFTDFGMHVNYVNANLYKRN